jgi:hypothetical protein
LSVLVLLLYISFDALIFNKKFIYLFYVQLRNLVWATSKHDVYLITHYSVRHWSALSSADTEILNVEGHVAPSEVGLVSKLSSEVTFLYVIYYLY